MWLRLLPTASPLALAGLCSQVVAADVARHPQRMGVMNVAAFRLFRGRLGAPLEVASPEFRPMMRIGRRAASRPRTR